ncbi:aspartate dehydrogenase [Agrobacterium vitis]|uniref:aspartate dehydrogenase n=1 Tax=Rhizobium/Agrobacterium group TaxID=227290 RepID=UPI0012E90DB2|nr:MULTISPECIES: aspartate dehydrogenase [Rhizobium/Agrobacterium group]MCF1464716.1 aspartate dehydrogenase [Allorhizobium ampelinum]MVA52774.1 aspartate dehydrogenase [Agrobacterium vitis]
MIKPRHIGIIGYGAIGRQLAALLQRQAGYRVSVFVRSNPASYADPETDFVSSFDEFLAARPDAIVEAASAAAFVALVPRCLDQGIDVIAASIGALSAPDTLQLVTDICEGSGARLIMPSGSIGGLDYLAAAALVGDAMVTYTSRKPPAAWRAELAGLALTDTVKDEAVTLFEGTAAAAAALYPKNLNAGLTIALAIGMDRTRVRVVADPHVVDNTHEIEVVSHAGRASMRFENTPSPNNPKTSAITAFSLAAAVIRKFNNQF